MKQTDDHKIVLLQENLAIIRRIANWTAEDLGNMLGLTRQAISNLERGKTKLTKAQYIAIRAIVDQEIRENPEKEFLGQAVRLLVDTDDLSDEEKLSFSKVNELVKNLKASKKESATVAADVLTATLTASLLAPLVVTTTVGASWLSILIKNSTKK